MVLGQSPVHMYISHSAAMAILYVDDSFQQGTNSNKINNVYESFLPTALRSQLLWRLQLVHLHLSSPLWPVAAPRLHFDTGW